MSKSNTKVNSAFIQDVDQFCITFDHGVTAMSELCVDAILPWNPPSSHHHKQCVILNDFNRLDASHVTSLKYLFQSHEALPHKHFFIFCTDKCSRFKWIKPTKLNKSQTKFTIYGNTNGCLLDTFEDHDYCIATSNAATLISLRAFLYCDAEIGFRPSVLREISIMRLLSFPRRLLHVSIDTEHGGVMFVMPYLHDEIDTSARNPVLKSKFEQVALHNSLTLPHNRKQDVSSLWKKAWLFQYLSAINFFHQNNMCYLRILFASLLLEGAYVPDIKQLLDSKSISNAMHLDAASAHCFSGTVEVMCAGDLTLGNLLYVPPEILLSSESQRAERKLASDMWIFGACLHHLYADLFLFPINETQSHFSQLVEIFKILGTPNETSWPGVSSLAHYNDQFPIWNNSILESSLKISFLDPLVIDLLMKIFVCCPEKRITSKEALDHPYFDELKNAITEMKFKFNSGDNYTSDLNFNISASLDFIFKHQAIDYSYFEEIKSPVKCDLAYTTSVQTSLSSLISNGFVSRSIYPIIFFLNKVGNFSSNGMYLKTCTNIYNLINNETPSPLNNVFKFSSIAKDKHWTGMKCKKKNRFKIRGILVDWLINVTKEFSLSIDTLCLSVHILDKVINKLTIEKNKIQLIGEVCLLIASKLIDCSRIICTEFEIISDKAFSTSEIKEMELNVIKALDFNFNLVTPLYLLRILLTFYNSTLKTIYLSMYLCELFLAHEDYICFLSSDISIALFCCSYGISISEFEHSMKLNLPSSKSLLDCYNLINGCWRDGIKFGNGPYPKDNIITELLTLTKKSFELTSAFQKYSVEAFYSVSLVNFSSLNCSHSLDKVSALPSSLLINILSFLKHVEITSFMSLSYVFYSASSSPLLWNDCNLSLYSSSGKFNSTSLLLCSANTLFNHSKLSLCGGKFTAASIFKLLNNHILVEINLSYSIILGDLFNLLTLGSTHTDSAIIPYIETDELRIEDDYTNFNLYDVGMTIASNGLFMKQNIHCFFDDDFLKHEKVLYDLVKVSKPYLHNINISKFNYLSSINFSGSNIDSKSILFIVSRSVVLETLHLNYLDCVNDVFFKKLGSIQPITIKLKTLTVSNCSYLSNNGIIKSLCYFPFLTYFDVSGSPVVSDLCLDNLPVFCPMINKISFSLCSLLTNFGVKSLTSHYTFLKEIDLSYCFRLTNDGITFLCQNCLFLTTIDLCNLLNIDEDVIVKILQSCRYLQKLNISGCTKMTSMLLIFILNNYQQLINLNTFLIMNCPEMTVSENDLISINAVLPELAIYYS